MNRIKYLLGVGLAETVAVIRRNNAILLGTRTLMYHDLEEGNSSSAIYLLSSTSFRNQMRTLSEFAHEKQTRFVRLTAEPQPGLAVTFDDGYRSTLTIAAPLLVELGIPFHVFATKAYCQSGDGRYLTERELRELSTLPNVVIGTHGATHTHFAKVSAAALERELSDARDWLQQTLQMPVNSLSYPHGSHTSTVSEAVQRHGYHYACSSQSGTFRSTTQRFNIPRIDIWSRDSARTALSKLRGAWDWLL